VKVNQEKGIAFFYEEKMTDVNENRLRFLDFKKITEKKSISNFSQEINPWPILVDTKSGMCLNLVTRITEDSIFYYGYSPDLELVRIGLDDFNNTRMTGSPGAPLYNQDFQSFVVDSHNGELKMTLTRNIQSRPIFKIKLPKSYWPKENRRAVTYVHTEKLFLTRMLDSKETNLVEQTSIFYLFNKHSGKWADLTVLGDKTRIQSFGDWISGSVIYSNGDGKLSPGHESRQKDSDLYGPTFDVMTKILRLYYPGKLFIYNIESEQLIEWSTSQGDSEVLYVTDRTIFYRVDNSLYQAAILERKVLGKSKLVVKDDRVRNIHWMILVDKSK